MKYRYITIEREYGSGGTKIAENCQRPAIFPAMGMKFLKQWPKKEEFRQSVSINMKKKQQEAFCILCSL